jgi:DNA-directed RNA polymerase subunit beta
MSKVDYTTTVGTWPKKTFEKYKEPFVKLPNLFEGQTESFKWLIKEGVQDVFDEFSPIKDYSDKKFELSFDSFELGDPKYDEKYSKVNRLTYEAPLTVKVKLVNKTIGTEKEQEVFMADFPMMTRHGTFIVNGVERVVVPQLARSYGVIFNTNLVRGRRYFGAKIIPGRGAWIELETDAEDNIFVKIDKNRKFPMTTFLRVMGLDTDKEMLDFFKKDERAHTAIKRTLEKDPVLDADSAYLDVYKRLRDGDLLSTKHGHVLHDREDMRVHLLHEVSFAMQTTLW